MNQEQAERIVSTQAVRLVFAIKEHTQDKGQQGALFQAIAQRAFSIINGQGTNQIIEGGLVREVPDSEINRPETTEKGDATL